MYKYNSLKKIELICKKLDQNQACRNYFNGCIFKDTPAIVALKSLLNAFKLSLNQTVCNFYMYILKKE